MEKVRLGIVGLGGRGKYLSAMLLEMERCEICSVCDVYADRVEELQNMVKDKKGTVPYGTLDYKEQIAHGGIDALVLGCTHYPHIKDKILSKLPASVKIYDGGEGTARHTKRLLEKAGLLTDSASQGHVEILNSSSNEKFIELSKKLLYR